MPGSPLYSTNLTPSPGFTAARRTSDDGPGLGQLACRPLLGFVLVEHRLGRRIALGAEFGPVVAAPLIGGGTAFVETAEMRHHIAGVELIGTLARLEIRPVMRLM